MSTVTATFEKIHHEYGGDHQPLAAYATLLSIYGLAFSTYVALAKEGKVSTPENVSLADILLMGIATHKLTRIIALDEVTSPIRAPFAKFAGEGNVPSEVSEHPRGRGIQKAVGTLLTCPYCLAPWVGVAALAGLAVAPKIARTVATLFVIAAISDWANTAFDHAWKS